jgi:hypothetical protein
MVLGGGLVQAKIQVAASAYNKPPTYLHAAVVHATPSALHVFGRAADHPRVADGNANTC